LSGDSDRLAFLKEATQPGRTPPSNAQRGGSMGGTGGMMGGGAVPNLKRLDAEGSRPADRSLRR